MLVRKFINDFVIDIVHTIAPVMVPEFETRFKLELPDIAAPLDPVAPVDPVAPLLPILVEPEEPAGPPAPPEYPYHVFSDVVLSAAT
jgi:hypothetical protein